MSIPISLFIPPPLFPLGNHKFVFYICDSISVLKIGSFVQFVLDFIYKHYLMIFVFICLTYITQYEHL